MDFDSIGFFQLDNLIRGRVPFFIFSIGVDLTQIFNGPMEKIHLRQFGFNFNEETTNPLELSDLIFSKISENQIAKDAPLLFVCSRGDKSRKLRDQAIIKGFKNGFYIQGGFDQLMIDFKDSMENP
jgi:rhodanese-related sulfurtransferase